MADLQWGVFFADLSPVIGSEQSGKGPVLVVSRESIHRVLPVVGICPVTSRKPGRKIYPTEILIEAGLAGLKVDSLVLGHQFRTVAKERLGSRLGLLDSHPLRVQVRHALMLFLDLDS
jgi:mRNA interferase MazF